MELLILNPGFNVQDVNPLEDMLAAVDPFVKCPLPPVDKYDLESYVYASTALKKELFALLDNNLITRVIELSSGGEIPEAPDKKPAYLLSSAVMGFLVAADFVVDPTMAIYEKASSLGHEAALEQLFKFRVADHIQPQAWIDLALERTTRIPSYEISRATASVKENASGEGEDNFAKQLDSWKLNYYFVLKAASIWKEKRHDIEAALTFIDWMESESFFNSVAAIFTLIFFSPKRYAKMVKGIESPSIQRLQYGLKNAAWDLAYIKYWAKQCKNTDENTFWLLCSNDLALRNIASHIFNNPDLGESHLSSILQNYWGNNKGCQILRVYQDVWNRIASDEATRDTNLLPQFKKVDEAIATLGKQLEPKGDRYIFHNQVVCVGRTV